MYQVKRVYEPASDADGFRVLVDRIWPRGESKVKAKLDLWLKEVAPSTELRKWFGHDPAKFAEFQQRYQAELQHDPYSAAAFKTLQKLGTEHAVVTLVYAAKDEGHNNADVLLDLLQK